MRFPLDVAIGIAEDLVERLAPFCEDERIEIAGSIRRRRADVGDIDIVAIPRLETVKSGLFATETQRPKDSKLAIELCVDRKWVDAYERGRKLPRGVGVLQRGDKTVSVQLPLPERLVRRARRHESEMPAAAFVEGIRVDLYLATAESWATTLLIRTGSAAHNVFLCMRARSLGGILHASGEGLELPGPYDELAQKAGPLVKMRPQDEADILAVLTAPPLTAPRERYIPEPPCWSNARGGIPPELRECDGNGRPAWMDGRNRAIGSPPNPPRPKNDKPVA